LSESSERERAKGTVLAVGTHPDDVEFLVAGTLALLRDRGYSICIATMCTGDMGSMELRGPEISRKRFQEASNAALVLGAPYICLGESDLHLIFDTPTRSKAVELVRKVDPLIVMTHSPEDYMLDHQLTANLMWDACFSASVPNYVTNQVNPAKPTNRIPYLIYADALGGTDRFGHRTEVDFYVDITSTISVKEQMLVHHESQRSWLRAKHGVDHYILQMKGWSEARGTEVGLKYAEAFRQHGGHPFPSDNIMARVLGPLCKYRRG